MTLEIPTEEWLNLRRDVQDALSAIKTLNETVKIQNGRIGKSEVSIGQIHGEMAIGEGRKRPITVWDVVMVATAIVSTVGVLQFAHFLKWQ